jgi:hypothetical protein
MTIYIAEIGSRAVVAPNKIDCMIEGAILVLNRGVDHK